MTAAPAIARTDARVEVQRRDFAVAGMPLVWRTAVVEKVTPVGRLFDLSVRFEDGLLQVERVGPRGGGRVRLAQ